MKESYLNYHFENLLPETKWLFVTPSLESHMLQIQVQEVGHLIYNNRSFTDRGPLQSYQIIMSYRSTQGKYQINGSEYPHMKEKEIAFIDCTKGYRVDTYGESDCLFVHFWGDNIAYYYNLFTQKNGGDPVVHAYSQLINDNLNQLLRLYSKPNDLQADTLAEMLIMEMVIEFVKMVTPARHSGYSEYTQKAIDLIRENYMEHISLDTLAQQVHVSKYYFSHLFKEETGLTPANYLQQVRLSKAKELLRATTLSQDEICSKVGLYNSSYLSRLFRTHEKVTPDQYRRSWK